VRSGPPTGEITGGTRLPHRLLLAVMVTVVVAPFLPLLLQSVAHGWFFPAVLPDRLSTRSWQYVAGGSSMTLAAAATSLRIALWVTGVAAVLGVPAARVVSALSPKLRAALQFFFLMPVIIPGLSVALGMHVLFVRLGVADTTAGVVMAHLLPTVPYMVLVMVGTFTHENRELEWQARTLGAGAVRAFLTVGLRAALPGVAAGALFVFLISWSQYALTLLVGGGRVVTLPILLFSFATAGDNGITAALALVFVAPALVLLPVAARLLSGQSLALGGAALR
jgi:putative spermidine/putrescine transport system permease protein